jgi:dTDP-4-amino-4,6-dideoxygalactose transaminase
MQVPLLDLKREYAALRDEINSAVKAVFDATNFINGSQVADLESAVAGYCSTRFAVGVASGTDALLLSLRACGVGPGDEVITTPFSFFATAGAIANAGARPVFIDINVDDFNIDVEQIETAISKRTRAIMPVDLFGQSANLEPILEIARAHKLVVIEDAAQALSAEYQGHKTGSMADFGCFSFYPSKNLGAAGDGGMIVTNSEKYDEILRKLKKHGGMSEYYHDLVGYNSRLDTLQAALLLVKLPHLDEWSLARRANADYYDKRFSGTAIKTPVRRDFAYHIFNQYTILTPDRDDLKQHLSDQGIGNKVYYPKPLHLQPCFKSLGYAEGDFPVAERCAGQALSIPIFPQLNAAEREHVADTILDFIS